MSRLKPRIDHGGGRVAIRLQDVGQRLSFIILVSAAVVLLLAGRADGERMESLRTTLSDFTAPVLELSSLPIQGLRSYFDNIDQYFNTVEENRILRAKIERLQMWQQFAAKLESENKEFRSLLNAQEIPASPFVSARVIGDLGSPFVHTVLINAGVHQGIKKGMPVIGAEGLIGQVVSAGKQVSRVLLLSDLNSRIPVSLESSGYQAVLGGDNGAQPQLLYLPPRAKVAVGDHLVTSGHGGFFPPGIPVGTIDSLNNGPSKNEVRVQSFSDEHRLTFVRILQYHVLDSPPGTIGVPQDPASKEGAPTLPATPAVSAGGR